MAGERTNVSETPKGDTSNTETLKNKASEAAADLRNRASETRDEVREHADALSAQAKEAMSEYYQQGREKAVKWEQVLESQIRAKPLQSLLVASGIGLVIGLLWRR